MTPPASDAVSVIIVTYQRAEACERALRSVLAQGTSALEVLVCDDCSTDDTEARMRDWERRDGRVRYLRSPRNSGGPAAPRNLGVEHARGDWIGFLDDDDDEWLDGKLAAQLQTVASGDVDVVATNALRSDGTPYFPAASPIWRPTRADLLESNPIIMSSALIRRDLLKSSDGFPTESWMTGIEDYALWLELGARGARFAILGTPLVRYEDAAAGRLSRERAHGQLGVARLAWRHALNRPVQARSVKSAFKQSAGVVYVLASETLQTARERRAR